MSGNDEYQEENSIENFAYLIDSQDEEKVREIIRRGDEFKVLEKFGTKDNLSEGCPSKLTDLAEHLSLDVDPDILADYGFTPLMLAVMFGPPKSVETILNKVGKDGIKKKLKRTILLRLNCTSLEEK